MAYPEYELVCQIIVGPHPEAEYPSMEAARKPLQDKYRNKFNPNSISLGTDCLILDRVSLSGREYAILTLGLDPNDPLYKDVTGVSVYAIRNYP